MWKPGEERPSKGRQKKKGKNGQPGDTAGLAKNKSSPAVKKLSSGTMNMRFMQRTSVSPKQVVVPQPSTPRDDNVELADGTTTPNRFATATAQDMYGTIIMGRRSFGGFRPVVEQMYQQSVEAVGRNEGTRKRKRSAK